MYFLLTREKNLLYIIRQPQEAMKTTLEGVRHFMIEDQFAADFWRWWECIEQCALIGNKQAENSEKIHFYVQATVFVLFHLSHLILIAPRTVHVIKPQCCGAGVGTGAGGAEIIRPGAGAEIICFKFFCSSQFGGC